MACRLFGAKPLFDGLSPIRRQAIIWTNAGLLSSGRFRTNFSEILIKVQSVSVTKMNLKTSSAKWRPFCPRGDALSKTVQGPREQLHWSTWKNIFLVYASLNWIFTPCSPCDNKTISIKQCLISIFNNQIVHIIAYHWINTLSPSLHMVV